MIRIQNVSGKAILMCLIPILVGVIFDGIICSKTPFKGFSNQRGPDSFTIYSVTKNVLNMANSADPDETPRVAASHLGLRYL